MRNDSEDQSRPELAFTGTYDLLARAFHEEYVLSEKEKGSTTETNPFYGSLGKAVG